MDNFSRLSGAGHVSPVSDRLWGVQKKRRMDDRKQEERKRFKRKRQSKEEEEAKAIDKTDESSEKKASDGPEIEGGAGYSSSGAKKRIRRKIDLII